MARSPRSSRRPAPSRPWPFLARAARLSAASALAAGCASGGGGNSGAASGPIDNAAAGAMTTTRVAAGSNAGMLEFRTTADGPAGTETAVSAPAEKVWPAMPEVYEGLGITINTVMSNGYTLGLKDGRVARRLGKLPLSRYLDCGTDATSMPHADAYDVTLTVMSRVAATSAAASTVVTQVMATAKPRSVSGNTLNCASTGALELAINRAAAAAAAK